MNIHRWLWQAGAVSFLAVSMAFCLSGCGSAGKQSGEQTEESISAQPLEEGSDIMEGDSSQEDWILGGAGILPGEDSEYETAPEETEPEPDPAPEYYRPGVEHESVAALQARLMELGFMENDEPTTYYGSVTEAAIKTFQRQGPPRGMRSWIPAQNIMRWETAIREKTYGGFRAVCTSLAIWPRKIW